MFCIYLPTRCALRALLIQGQCLPTCAGFPAALRKELPPASGGPGEEESLSNSLWGLTNQKVGPNSELLCRPPSFHTALLSRVHQEQDAIQFLKCWSWTDLLLANSMRAGQGRGLCAFQMNRASQSQLTRIKCLLHVGKAHSCCAALILLASHPF